MSKTDGTQVVRSALGVSKRTRCGTETNVGVVDERSETMRKRFLAVTAATSLAVGTLAGSALAHPNTAAGKSVGPPADAPQTGHMGMECGAQNPNTPLVSLAPAVSCPAP